MALDNKSIKEEIHDKDIHESTLIRSGRAPDSPESVRAVALQSPSSPKTQYAHLSLQRTSNGSTSPIQRGGSNTPPQTSSAVSTPKTVSPILLSDKELYKLRKFLGTLYQFAQDTSAECGDRVRSLIFSLVSDSLSTEAFKQALQESVNFPLRPYVLPFLKSHVPILKSHLSNLAKNQNQSILHYIRLNESSVFEFVSSPAENSSSDIFVSCDASKNGNNRQPLSGNSRILLKRRTSEGLYDHQNGLHEWTDFVLQSKRSHQMMNSTTSNGHLINNYTSICDYNTAPVSQIEQFPNLLDKNTTREDVRVTNGNSSAISSNTHTSSNTDVHSNSGTVGSTGNIQVSSSAMANRGEEEWKNIYTMLNCISAMVDKTKRAITILQQRGVESPSIYPDISIAEIKRQTEEKVAEFRRHAEETVNQVKRQAVMEIQRAVAAAETRAIEAMAQERIKMDKMLTENNSDRNKCWNCGRKANETCSGCNLARYCGSFCQHKDWEQHHQVCGTRNQTANIATTRSSPPSMVQSHQSQQPQTSQSMAQQTVLNNIANTNS